MEKKQKKNAPLQGSVRRVCKRDFCSHVFANPDRYILRVNLFETSDNFLSSEFTVALSGLRFLLAYSILVSPAKR